MENKKEIKDYVVSLLFQRNNENGVINNRMFQITIVNALSPEDAFNRAYNKACEDLEAYNNACEDLEPGFDLAIKLVMDIDESLDRARSRVNKNNSPLPTPVKLPRRIDELIENTQYIDDQTIKIDPHFTEYDKENAKGKIDHLKGDYSSVQFAKSSLDMVLDSNMITYLVTEDERKILSESDKILTILGKRLKDGITSLE